MGTPFSLLSRRLAEKLKTSEAPAAIKTALMAAGQITACEHFEHLHVLFREDKKFTVESLGVAILLVATADLGDEVEDALYFLVKEFDKVSPIEVPKPPNGG